MDTQSQNQDTTQDKVMENDIDMVMDIPVTLSLEVGSAEISIDQLLSMGDGAIVELDRQAGEPLDVKVNGMLVGHAEVVEVKGKYGIRLIEVVTQQERLQQLA